MDNCKITFEEKDKKIIIDFTVDDNDIADYNIRMEPEVKDKTEEIGLMGYLCELFLKAVHDGAEPEPEEENENKS